MTSTFDPGTPPFLFAAKRRAATELAANGTCSLVGNAAAFFCD